MTFGASADSSKPISDKNFRSPNFIFQPKMETISSLLEGEWNSFSGMYSNEEEEVMAQLLGNFSLPNEFTSSCGFEVPFTFWPHHEPTMNAEASSYCSYNTNTSTHCVSPGNSYTDGSAPFPTSSGESYFPIGALRGDEITISATHDFLNNNLLVGKEGNETSMTEPSTEVNNLSEISRKRSFSLADVQKSGENTNSRKSRKLGRTGDKGEANHVAVCTQSTNGCGMDDDSNGSQEFNASPRPNEVAALNSNGKTRASRGSATDPQSIYARKRRERINERLRILQNLVPNGTKVDISTMLEEAVEYVKFLQLQIKLLSSDDLWMYAPIAYNGMDIGLDLKIPSPR